VASELHRHWLLDPRITYVNHGGYGACPRPVLEAQREWRDRMEREPALFHDTDLDGLLEHARGRLGEFVNADGADIAFVPNVTTGINTVVNALEFEPGDEIIGIDHEYNAVLNTIRRAAARTGARLVLAHVPFPVKSPDEVFDAVMGSVTARTKLAVISHVTSPTALIFPVARIVAALNEKGIDTVIDGAHGPGMVPVDVAAIGAAYYAGHCHKWLCAPKGAAFLHVRPDRQERIYPVITSHGMNAPRAGRTRFRLEFDWTGTGDPSAYLSVPAALDFMASLMPGGWPAIMERNHNLVLAGRDAVRAVLKTAPLAPDEMIGSIAAITMPTTARPGPLERPSDDPDESTYGRDPLHDALIDEDMIEVPIFTWPHTPADGGPRQRLIRVSAQLYNDQADYGRLAAALTARL
jgi:isopenicillin-N epimerase